MTNADIVDEVASLCADIRAMKWRLTGAIRAWKTDIVMWMAVLLAIQGWAVVTAVRLLPGH